MNKLKVLGISVVLLILVNLLLLAFLFFGRPHPPGKHGPRDYMIEKLHFTQDQIEKFDHLIVQHRQQIDQLDSKINALKNSLYLQLSKDAKSFSQDSIIQQIGVTQMQIEQVNYSHFKEVKKLCSSDQLAYFDSLAAELASLFSHRPPRRRH
jgi:protein CpxP